MAALTEALDLWAGPALASVRDDAGLAVEAAALDARRADAEDDLARALLAAGRAGAAVDLLERLVVADPLREGRWGQLMMALHRDDRQAEALRAYQRAHAVLAEEAGLEPGRELRRIERAVILQDPGLDAPRSWSAAASLPAPLVRVVGRDDERDEVRERLRSSRLVTLVGPAASARRRPPSTWPPAWPRPSPTGRRWSTWRAPDPARSRPWPRRRSGSSRPPATPSAGWRWRWRGARRWSSSTTASTCWTTWPPSRSRSCGRPPGCASSPPARSRCGWRARRS